jgi:hypothetical protein
MKFSCRNQSKISVFFLVKPLYYEQMRNFIYDVINEFKTIMVEKYHKFHMHYITNDFKIVLVEADERFHI